MATPGRCFSFAGSGCNTDEICQGFPTRVRIGQIKNEKVDPAKNIKVFVQMYDCKSCSLEDRDDTLARRAAPLSCSIAQGNQEEVAVE
jgi:hypothetical protein